MRLFGRRWPDLSRLLGIALCLSFTSCKTTPVPAPVSSVPAPVQPASVLLGEAQLTCNIDSRENGMQKIVITKGGGLEFDAVVTPIIDGVLSLKSPKEGATYRFTSHLAKAAKGNLIGVGEVTIDKLETKVSIGLNQYQQPKGPGTPLSFVSSDMSIRANYVDFLGAAKAPNGEEYTFHINFGAPNKGSGKITPTDANFTTRLLAKTVNIDGPMATVITSKPAATTTERQQ